VRNAAEGDAFAIERRGPACMPAGRKALIFASMEERWARMPEVGDSAKIIEQDRDRSASLDSSPRR